MIRKRAVRISALVALMVFVINVSASYAQMSSMTTISPYTMYGLGDLAVGGSSFNRSMAGTGIGFRHPHYFNYMNPASLSGVPRQSALFNFGAEGVNYYEKNATTTTSYNGFSFHDLGLAIPLGRGVGLGLSMTPVSSVGYNSRIIDDNSNIIEDIGSIVYDYAGDGGITQLTAGLGVNLGKGFSVGASMNYWFGSITREYNVTVNNHVTANSYRGISSAENYNVSRMIYNLAAQYTFTVGKGNAFTVGAVYQFHANNTTVRYRQHSIATSNSAVDTISLIKERQNLKIPQKFSAGFFYQNPRLTVGMDYSRQDWKGSYEIPAEQQITLGVQQDFRLGFSYTPNRYDIRNQFKRWTYKFGARYTTNYLRMYGRELNDLAFTFGVDFPMKRNSNSKLGMGIELGQRGTTKHGLVREQYFKYFLSLSLFGDDYWFVRQRYN